MLDLSEDRGISVIERFGKVIDVYYSILINKHNLPMFGLREIQRDAPYLFETLMKVSDDQIRVIREILLSEMEQGKIRTLSIEFIIYSFYGLLFTPFTLHPMVKLVADVPDPLDAEYLSRWNVEVVRQIGALLAVE